MGIPLVHDHPALSRDISLTHEGRTIHTNNKTLDVQDFLELYRLAHQSHPRIIISKIETRNIRHSTALHQQRQRETQQ